MSFTAHANYGEYLHNLTVEELAKHDHYISGYSDSFGTSHYYQFISGVNSYGEKHTETSGSGKGHNNIQPCIGTYIWKRIA